MNWLLWWINVCQEDLVTNWNCNMFLVSSSYTDNCEYLFHLWFFIPHFTHILSYTLHGLFRWWFLFLLLPLLLSWLWSNNFYGTFTIHEIVLSLWFIFRANCHNSDEPPHHLIVTPFSLSPPLPPLSNLNQWDFVSKMIFSGRYFFIRDFSSSTSGMTNHDKQNVRGLMNLFLQNRKSSVEQPLSCSSELQTNTRNLSNQKTHQFAKRAYHWFP